MSRFDDILDPAEFEQAFYPGSKQHRRHGPERTGVDYPPFEGMKPRVYTVGGKQVEFFSIGQLAAALERKPVTIRKWEREGTLPRATFLAPNPTGDPRARRRLYSRAQAEGIVRIAIEEHLVRAAFPKQVGSTNFTGRVRALFQQLREAQ